MKNKQTEKEKGNSKINQKSIIKKTTSKKLLFISKCLFLGQARICSRPHQGLAYACMLKFSTFSI